MMNKIFSFSLASKSLLIGSLLSSLLMLSACGSGSSESKVEPNPNPNTGGGGNGEPFVYRGEKPAATADVVKFQNELWVNIAVTDKCGGCHTNQAPTFARGDDINLAYQAVFDGNLVNLQQPAESRLVTKVAGGHNCWVSDPSACADIITGWITKWAGDQATQANSIELKAPTDRNIDESRSFPSGTTEFTTEFDGNEHSLHELLTTYCSGCHSETANTRQQPYFASSDPEVAYQAAKSKIRLDNPAASRLVQRLTIDSHNCWDGDCMASGAEMTQAIAAFAASIPVNKVDEKLVVSKAVGLGDAFVLTSGGRIDSEIIAKYEFKTGSGSTAYDTSGSGIDLGIIGNVDWSSAWGVKVDIGGRLQSTVANSRKLTNHIISTGEYSIETWVIPDSVDQGPNEDNPARIVSLSGGDERNFTLGQYDYSYSFLNRTNESDISGTPEIITPEDDQVLQATLQHVVATFDPINGRRLYVNGELIEVDDPDAGAVLRDWDSGFAFVLGNETTGATPTQWKGAIRFVAVHKRALSAEDIKKNFDVGVGARYLLLFNISDLIDLPGSYIVFEVQQLDDHGYLFASPFFTNLEDRAPASSIPVRGIRIGVNGAEAPTGQSFANLNTNIEAGQIVDKRQLLSRVGAVVEAKLGPTDDVFFLTFDQIGSNSYARVEAEPAAPAAPAVTPEQATIGVRNFAEINATLSQLTGVVPANVDCSLLSNARALKCTYLKVEQQLPTSTAVNGFLASHQMGVTQLAVAYCSALVDSPSLRTSFFPGFNFGASAGAAFDTTGRNQIINPLLSKLLADELDNTSGGPSKLNNQADPALLRTELNNLIATISATGTTSTTVKAACSASLGSAVMLLQ